jgi:hypothetical protein
LRFYGFGGHIEYLKQIKKASGKSGGLYDLEKSAQTKT